MQTCAWENELSVNRPMAEVCRTRSLPEALFVLKLLEAQQIEAYYEALPSEFTNGLLMKGSVVVEPIFVDAAKRVLEALPLLCGYALAA